MTQFPPNSKNSFRKINKDCSFYGRKMMLPVFSLLLKGTVLLILLYKTKLHDIRDGHKLPVWWLATVHLMAEQVFNASQPHLVQREPIQRQHPGFPPTSLPDTGSKWAFCQRSWEALNTCSAVKWTGMNHQTGSSCPYLGQKKKKIKKRNICRFRPLTCP